MKKLKGKTQANVLPVATEQVRSEQKKNRSETGQSAPCGREERKRCSLVPNEHMRLTTEAHCSLSRSIETVIVFTFSPISMRE